MPSIRSINSIRGKRIAFLTAETEHSLVGGLAEVARSLPMALQAKGAEVVRFTPLHGIVWESAGQNLRHIELSQKVDVTVGKRRIPVSAYELTQPDIPTIYFKDFPEVPKGAAVNGKSLEQIFLQQRFNGGGITARQIIDAAFSRYFYRGRVYPSGEDLGENFYFATRAALALIRSGAFGEFDVIHFQDWHFAMAATLAKYDPKFQSLRHTALAGTIHNPFTWAMKPGDFSAMTGLTPERAPALYNAFEGLLHGYEMHFLKALQHADMSNTVSPTYARQLLTEEMGLSFHGLFSHLYDSGRFIGILNGLDERWNPATDDQIAANFSADDLTTREICKKELIEATGLQDDGSPIVTVLSRMTAQKGYDIINPLVEEFLQAGAQFVFLGSGEKQYLYFLNELARRYPGRMAVETGYNSKLSHSIYAGGDFFIRASYYEPCGLSQMISMLYGNIPIVHLTGGLNDTVFDIDEKGREANGFGFRHYSQSALRDRLWRAINIYQHDPAALTVLQQRGMRGDYSWDSLVDEYIEKIYLRAMEIAAQERPRE